MSEKEKLYNLLKETFILLDDGDRHLFNQFNLSPPRYYALYHLFESPGISSSLLSDKMLCDKSNVSRIIRNLEADNLIERKPHEADRRSFCLFLTDEGTAVVNQVIQAHKNFNARRLSCLDEIAEGNLLNNLSSLNQSLTQSIMKLRAGSERPEYNPHGK